MHESVCWETNAFQPVPLINKVFHLSINDLVSLGHAEVLRICWIPADQLQKIMRSQVNISPYTGWSHLQVTHYNQNFVTAPKKNPKHKKKPFHNKIFLKMKYFKLLFSSFLHSCQNHRLSLQQHLILHLSCCVIRRKRNGFPSVCVEDLWISISYQSLPRSSKFRHQWIYWLMGAELESRP